MGAVAMRPSRRDFGYGRSSTPSGGRSLRARLDPRAPVVQVIIIGHATEREAPHGVNLKGG